MTEKRKIGAIQRRLIPSYVFLILFSLFSGRGIYLDLAIITAMLGIIDTLLVGRYLEGRGWNDGAADRH